MRIRAHACRTRNTTTTWLGRSVLAQPRTPLAEMHKPDWDFYRLKTATQSATSANATTEAGWVRRRRSRLTAPTLRAPPKRSKTPAAWGHSRPRLGSQVIRVYVQVWRSGLMELPAARRKRRPRLERPKLDQLQPGICLHRPAALHDKIRSLKVMNVTPNVSRKIE